MQKEIACPTGGKPRAIRAVIRKEKLSFMERTMSEKIEEEHRKMAANETDEFQKEINLQLAAAQAKMRKEGLVKLDLRCPDHPGEGEYSFFFEHLASYAPVIKQNILRCLKCGGSVSLESTKTSGSNKVLNIRCPEHGTGQRKISSSIHDVIMQSESPITAPAPPPQETEPPSQPSKPIPTADDDVTIHFCWNCGTKAIDASSQYCHKCGVSLRPP